MTKEIVLQIIKDNDLEIITDNFEFYELPNDDKTYKRHLIEISGSFDDLTSIICYGWKDAFERLTEYGYKAK